MLKASGARGQRLFECLSTLGLLKCTAWSVVRLAMFSNDFCETQPPASIG